MFISGGVIFYQARNLVRKNEGKDAYLAGIYFFLFVVWGYEYSIPIEKVHVKFCKRFIGLNQNTADFYALSECGRYPL